MGCRRADMGRLADRGARDAGLRPSRWIRATPYEILRFIGRGTSLNDYQRLKAASTGCNRPRWPRPSAKPREGACIALVDQRVEGTRRRQRGPAGHRADLAGLVLCRRARRRPGADHRPGLFPLEGRYRTLAVPPGAQAWRAAGARLAIRLPTPVPQIRQRGPLSDFAYDVRALVARQSLPGSVLGIERMPDDNTELLTFGPCRTRHGDNCGRTCGRPRAIRSTVSCYQEYDPSCYQEYENAGKPTTARVCVL